MSKRIPSDRPSPEKRAAVELNENELEAVSGGANPVPTSQWNCFECFPKSWKMTNSNGTSNAKASPKGPKPTDGS